MSSSAEAYSENARLEALERDNRRLQRYGGFLVAGMAVLIALGAVLVYATRTVSPEVAAQRFVIKDAQGVVRGVWGVAEDSSLRFIFQDRAGRPRVRISLLNDGSAGISLTDSGGRPRGVLALEENAGGSLVFADAAGRTRSVLGVAPEGAANLVFADQNGATRAGLGVNSLGLPTFTMTELNRRAPQPVEEDTAQPDSAPAPSNRRR
ncbi:MAG TPA: hypothetical protein VFM14_07820 [Gemmatimonadales bacterium]|nr:hypothetical protein [Gemmatimonadales bacterium]